MALGMILSADTALDAYFGLSFPMTGVMVLALAYWIVRSSWQRSRDIEFLSNVITRALGSETAPPGTSQPGTGSAYSNTALGK